LADGTIRIAAGTTKSGDGGLWIHWKDLTGKDRQGCLAIWNEYDLTPNEYSDCEQFKPYSGYTGDSFAGDCPLTPAAEKFLHDAAEAWCEETNARRENDSPKGLPEVKVA
jgi:hypothetical protein